MDTSKALHSFTYTSVNERDELIGTLHAFQTSSIVDYLHANTSRILSLGIFDNYELEVALTCPVTVIAISSTGTITAYAALKEKFITCKASLIGLRSDRQTTSLTSLYVELFGSVRGLRKPFAKYVCAIAHAAGYAAVTIQEPYNASFVCSKTDIMASKAVYITPSKPAFATIQLTVEPVAAAPVSDVIDVAMDTYAHICDVEFKEELFASHAFPVFPEVVKAKVLHHHVPALIPALLDDSECIIAQLLDDMGISIDAAADLEAAINVVIPFPMLKRPRAFSLEESPRKRMCA
jgi:hypothetical protein